MESSDPSRCFGLFAATGSPEALSRAFELVAADLWRMARSLTTDAHDAADLVQGTFLVAIQSAGRFRSDADLRPWLCGILRNLRRAWRRRACRTVSADEVEVPGPDGPDRFADRELIRSTVDRALSRLRARYREVVALHLQDGLSPDAIARRLGRNASTVRTQLWRGLGMLRESLPPRLYATSRARDEVAQGSRGSS